MKIVEDHQNGWTYEDAPACSTGPVQLHQERHLFTHLASIIVSIISFPSSSLSTSISTVIVRVSGPSECDMREISPSNVLRDTRQPQTSGVPLTEGGRC